MRLLPVVHRLALRIEQRVPARPDGSRRTRVRGDDGMSLVELMISMVVLLVVMGMTATVMSTFYSNENQLSASYTAFQQVLPASTALQQYFRTMTQAAPTAATGVPVPAFTPTATTPASALKGPFNIAPNSAVFTTDLGDPNGPALVTVTTTANTTPVGTYTLTVTQASANAGTCPGTGTGLSATAGALCTWGTAKRIFQITDLTNGSPTAASPVLQYSLSSAQNSVVPYSTANGSTWVTDFGAGSCTSVSNCPISLVQTVTIDIEVKAPGGQPAAYQTVVSALAPFYSKFVG